MKNLIMWFLNEVRQREAGEQVGVGKYERTGLRMIYCNGTRFRSFKLKYGSLDLSLPLSRDIIFKNTGI